MLRANRHMTKAPRGQNTPNRTLTEIDTVFLGDDPLQVCTAPSHDAIGLKIGSRFADGVKLSRLLRARSSRTAAARLVDKTVRALRVEPVNPVAQRLPVHAGPRRGDRARMPVHHRRDRRQTASLGDSPAQPCHSAQVGGTLILACDQNRHTDLVKTGQSESKIDPRVQPSQSFRRLVSHAELIEP